MEDHEEIDDKEEEQQTQNGVFKFRRFTEITSYESKSNLEKIIDSGYTADRYEWVMMEKIHGANFSILTNGTELICAKRTGLLEESDKFYGYAVVIEQIREKIILACNLLKEEFSDFETCTFFGELFGGIYPHSDVKKVSSGHVQKGVYYSPAVHLCFFDIFVTGHSYIDYDIMEKIMIKSGLMYSQALQRGTFKELVQFDIENFITTIPNHFGLPPLTNLKNIAEGIVLKPVKTVYCNHTRVIVKYKSEQFKEVVGLKKDKEKKKPKPPKNAPNFTEQELQFIDDLKRYITENRLTNVLSKLGELKPHDKARVSGLFVKDIIKDFEGDFPLFATLAKEDQKKVHGFVRPKAQKMVDNNWEKIILKEF